MNKYSNKPVIAISGESINSKSVQKMMHRLSDYGANPIFMDNPAQRNISHDISAIDALIIMGSDADINPNEYGEITTHHKTNISKNTARAKYENSIIKSALFYNIPMLGICAGMQRLNIGDEIEKTGSLHQHIPDITGNSHWQEDEGHIAVQPITILSDSKLSQIIGNQDNQSCTTENAFHHQAVNKVRDGFVVSALSDDGIIEAIEPDPKGKFADNFVLGVQWHPEFCASSVSEKIISQIVEQAKNFSKEKNSMANKGFASKVQSEILNGNILQI